MNTAADIKKQTEFEEINDNFKYQNERLSKLTTAISDKLYQITHFSSDMKEMADDKIKTPDTMVQKLRSEVSTLKILNDRLDLCYNHLEIII